ncbi:hypothetical protein HYU11_01535 [Candidatus Woesearchaeota archaeon]|nr:hypothetical protein [Candidatus Woesearchaeota archaeon]
MRKTLWVRKGVTVSAIMSLILLAITIFALLSYTGLITSGIESGFSREPCKQSVIRHSNLHIKSYNPPDEIINCPPTYLEFEKTKYSIEYRGKTRSIKLGDHAEKPIADEIYNCWNQFGEGKLDLFGGPKKYCSVCSIITFKEDMEINGYQFLDYLRKNTVPNKELAKEGITYLDYMRGKKGGIKPEIDTKNREELKQTTFDPDSAYAVVFVYAKSEPMLENMMEFIGKYWESNSGKISVIGGAVMLAGGFAVGVTGVGLPAGAALVVAGGAAIIRGITLETAMDASIEAYSKKNIIRDWTAFTIFGKYDENLLKDLGCEELPVKQQI